MQLHFAMNMVIKKEKIYSLTCEQAISKNIMHSKNYPRNHEGYFDLIKKLSLRYEYRAADFEEYLCICLNANKAAVI